MWPDIDLSHVGFLELTVPWEDHVEEAFERKISKNAGILSDCHQVGWRARLLPVELGFTGFATLFMVRDFSIF